MPTVKELIAQRRKIPADVEKIVTFEARAPEFDPTLGRAVVPPDGSGARHRLVTVGDSLTHGFQSGAIFNTDLSWPMIVAWEMGIDAQFNRPHYPGFGGLPINIEYLIRDLEKNWGEKLDPWEIPAAAFHIPHYLSELEDYWERGAGSQVPSKNTPICHNLAVFGFDIRDILSFTDKVAETRIKSNTDQWWFQNQIVEHSMEIAARRVLASARKGNQALSPLGAAAALGEDGGIETLVVAIGANNCLGAVTSLVPQWTDDSNDYADIDKKGAFNVWRPDHFKKELKAVVAQLKNIDAAHVILATVPHVTIAPVARGVGKTKIKPGSRYFPFYTRPWIRDDQFNSADDPNLTADEARAIDSAIDQYNVAIADEVRAARKAGKDWYLFEMCGLLDRLATRRYLNDGLAQPPWWTPYELPPELLALNPKPDTRFFRSGSDGRTEGGLFSLDGIHPTTIGYGLPAQEIINIMQLAGVKFHFGNGKERTGPVRVDFQRLLRNDTLVSNPPTSLENDLQLLGWLDEKVVGLFKRIFAHG